MDMSGGSSGSTRGCGRHQEGLSWPTNVHEGPVGLGETGESAGRSLRNQSGPRKLGMEPEVAGGSNMTDGSTRGCEQV